MKPDAWMPYYGNDINEAMRGHGPAMLGSYILALWHYWNHFHCSGLPNDDAYLRAVVGAELKDWAKVKAVLFDDGMFFCLRDGKWHQKRSREEYIKSCNVYAGKVKGGRTRASQIRQESSQESTQLTTPASTMESLSQSQSQSHRGTHTHRSMESCPSFEECQTHGERIGMSQSESEKFWHHYESSGWVDKNGNRVVNWRSKQSSWLADTRARTLETEHHKTGAQPASSPASITVSSKELDRVQERIRQLTNGVATDAMGAKFYTPKELDELKQLKARRTKLRQTLGVTI